MTVLSNLEPGQQSVVREKVRHALESSEAYAQMAPEARRDMANRMVNVVAYLADPHAGIATAQATDPATKTGNRLADKQHLVGEDFKAGAAQAGAQAYKDLTGAVDFPKFVGGLIDGVFNSIVSSSIRQMEAYGKMLEGVVKSVEQFASDHIQAGAARDYLANRYPDALSIQVNDNTPRLAAKEDAPDGAMERITKELGLKQAPDLSSPESEAELTRRAQLEMARIRQQQLSTMVLLGINRIVVTDGLINAKVVIDVKTKDTAQRKNTASFYDKKSENTHRESGGWFSDDVTSDNSHDTVVYSASSDTSNASVETKANLTGEVRVNFKSETFPLEKMASAVQVQNVQEKSAR